VFTNPNKVNLTKGREFLSDSFSSERKRDLTRLEKKENLASSHEIAGVGRGIFEISLY
jgi:hypothetical protein